MAEATVVIKYVSDLADRKREYDEYRRYVEANPVNIGASASAKGSQAGATATFANSDGVAPASGIPDPVVSRPAPRAADLAQQAIVVGRLATVGGSGFGPAVGPLPGAAQNSVYGPIGYERLTNPFGSVQALPGAIAAARAALPAPGANPYDVAAPSVAQQTAATRALAIRQAIDPLFGYRPERGPIVTPPPAEGIAYGGQPGFRIPRVDRGPVQPDDISRRRFVPFRLLPDLRPPASDGPRVMSGAEADEYASRRYLTTRGQAIESYAAAERADLVDRARRPGQTFEEADANYRYERRVRSRLRTPNPADFDDRRRQLGNSLNGGDGGDGPPNDPGNRRSFADSFRGALRGIGIALFAERSTIGSLQAVNEAAEAREAAGGDVFALARASIENNAARNFVSGVPLFGNAAVQLGEFATGSTLGANRILSAAQRQDAITAANRERAYAVRDARNLLDASQAGLAGRTAAEIVAIGQNTADAKSRELDFIRTNGAAAAADRDAALTRLNDAKSALATAQSPGFFRALAGAPLGAGGVFGTNTVAAQREVTAAQSAFDSAQARVDQVAARAAEITSLSNANDSTRLRAISQSEDDRFYQSRSATEAFESGRRQSRLGQTLEARLSAVDEQFDPQIGQARRDFERLAATDDSKFSAEQKRALLDAQVAAMETERGLTARRDAARQDARTDEARTQIGVQTELNAGRARLNFNPLAAQLANVSGQFAQNVAGLDLSNPATYASPAYANAVALAAQQGQEARQQSAIARISAGSSIAIARGQTAALLARDPTRATAVGIEGSALSEASSLFRSGVENRPLARERLRLGQDQLALEGQQFGDAFRATEVNPFYFAPTDRDSIDPSRVFADLNKRSAALGNVAASADADFVGKSGDALGSLGGGGSNIEAIVRAATAEIVRAIRGNGDGSGDGGGWTGS